MTCTVPMDTATNTVSESTIGYSSCGRPLVVRIFGEPTASLRLFFLCGQHGDERAIRRSTQEFSQYLTEKMAAHYPGICIAILDDANPDGAAARTRCNAQGIDLNRDHLLLRAPETQAIHRFVAAWRPHLVVDLHNYPARRAHLLRRRVRLAWDVCVDFPSNPAAYFSAEAPVHHSLMNCLDAALSASGFLFGRYTIVREGKAVRHGTPDLVDARNVLALRYGVPTILLEARNPQQAEAGSRRRWLRRGAALACAEIVRWAALHREALAGLCSEAPRAGRVPIRSRRRAAARGIEVPVVDLGSGRSGTLPFASYRPIVEGRRHIDPPFAYAVPFGENELLRMLAAQRFNAIAPNASQTFLVEEFRFPEASPSAAGLPHGKHRATRITDERGLEGFVLFPYRQTGGRCLALILECESQFAPHRRGELSISTTPGRVFPIRRVLEPRSPQGRDFNLEVTQ